MLFGKLLPTEGNFFVMFNQHADRIVEAVHAFSHSAGFDVYAYTGCDYVAVHHDGHQSDFMVIFLGLKTWR